MSLVHTGLSPVVSNTGFRGTDSGDTERLGETECFGDTEFSDEELTALALAADPDQLPDESAVPLTFYQSRAPGGLPLWYMPPVVVRRWRGWRLPVVLAVIAGFLLVDALGFCITYGQLVFA